MTTTEGEWPCMARVSTNRDTFAHSILSSTHSNKPLAVLLVQASLRLDKQQVWPIMVRKTTQAAKLSGSLSSKMDQASL